MKTSLVKQILFALFAFACQAAYGETVRGIIEDSSAKGRVTESIGIKIEDERNPVGVAPVKWLRSREKAIILIHGWNPDAVENPLLTRALNR